MRPHHIAISLGGQGIFSRKHNVPFDEIYDRMIFKVNELVDLQVKHNIPILTVYVVTSNVRNSKYYSSIMDSLENFAKKLKEDKFIFENKIKVSILGKWYDLPGRVIDPLKELITETRDYDNFFLNLCINYDGQEEIVDACRMIARKVKADKLDPEAIGKETIKDSIYSSYFLPPDLLIKTGKDNKLKGFLLWDSTHSYIHIPRKVWLDFEEEDFLKAIDKWAKSKRKE